MPFVRKVLYLQFLIIAMWGSSFLGPGQKSRALDCHELLGDCQSDRVSIDLNGDGILDLALVDFRCDCISILRRPLCALRQPRWHLSGGAELAGYLKERGQP